MGTENRPAAGQLGSLLGWLGALASAAFTLWITVVLIQAHVSGWGLFMWVVWGLIWTCKWALIPLQARARE